ncbi:MAG: hypothetical protein J07HQX50_01453 [Haloquadratum sp. J07HQX50]|nr:MAG: hypothetical protein J07HQX50_01453 [Haloquadratum sp. J07HQX50]
MNVEGNGGVISIVVMMLTQVPTRTTGGAVKTGERSFIARGPAWPARMTTPITLAFFRLTPPLARSRSV